MTHKYAEGYPGKRYYGGCEFVDIAEDLARERAKKLFQAEYVNVQPHSGSQANMGVYFGAIEIGDTILGMNLSHGGHLTHGSPVNFSIKLYNVVFYGVQKETGTIDYDQVEKLALEHKPKLIVAGASAYPRIIDFEGFRSIADEVDARLMVDMAHIAGLVAAGVHPSPIPHADVVTTTTHKTLRGPRSGLILCRKKWRKKIDSAVFPGGQGGPLMHQVAARAVCFREALTDQFRDYSRQVVDNSIHLGQILSDGGLRLVSGGTDNHMILADLRSLDLTGDIAEAALGRAGIVVNMNMIPYDPAPPRRPSGMRIGTPTITSRSMGEEEVRRIGGMILEVLKKPDDKNSIEGIRARVREMCKGYPTRIQG